MGSGAKPVVCIVTPGTRSANNGNWRTAVRWAEMLRDRYRIIVQTRWQGEPADTLIALHAKRSADSVAAFREQARGKRLGVMLTGTDLYRDLPGSREAARSLDLADRIVVLQEDALTLLKPSWQAKAQVIFQSAPLLRPRKKPPGRLRCVAVGHLRGEKDPETLFRAIASLPPDLPIFVRHIGDALEPELGKAALELARRDPRYRYSGALPRGLARAAIQAAHVLVHPSVIEGGANVVVEAITSGTPVIASRISGNVGMLGADYAGYFAPRDAHGLARAMQRALLEPGYLRALGTACRARRPLFTPAAESRAVHRFVAALLA